MAMSNEIDKLATALANVQASLEGAKKDSVNYFNSKYADLGSVWEAAKPFMKENGLAVAQTMSFIKPDTGALTTTLVTTLMHTSGQYISGEMPLYLKSSDPQGQGSAITYARRYSLAAILGIHQTDDDAELAQERSKSRTKEKAPADMGDHEYSKTTLLNAFASLNKGITRLKLQNYLGHSFDQISSDEYDALVKIYEQIATNKLTVEMVFGKKE